VLLHSDWLDIVPGFKDRIEVQPKRIKYESFSGLLFHSETEQWRQSVNRALTRMHEQKIIQAIAGNDSYKKHFA